MGELRAIPLGGLARLIITWGFGLDVPRVLHVYIARAGEVIAAAHVPGQLVNPVRVAVCRVDRVALSLYSL